MKVQITSDVFADIVEIKSNLPIPYHSAPIYVIGCQLLTDFDHQTTRSFGCRWDPMFHTTDELLFELESGFLAYILFGDRLSDYDKEPLPERWLSSKTIKGTLQISQIVDFKFQFDNKIWKASDCSYFSCFDESVFDYPLDHFRLEIAQDLFLLISDHRLAGWMLMNPFEYWAEGNLRNNQQLKALFCEYFRLISYPYIDKLLDDDDETICLYKDLKRRLLEIDDKNQYILELAEEIDAILENLVG